VEEEIAKSIKGCAKEEEAYKSKIWAQNRAFQVQLATMMLRYISLGIPHQSNLSTFKDLDDRICGIGNIAMRIGTQANKQPTLISLTCLWQVINWRLWRNSAPLPLRRKVAFAITTESFSFITNAPYMCFSIPCTELINYFSELCSGEVKSPIFLHKGMLRERARLLKKLGVFVKEIERAEEEMSHLKAEHVR